MRKRLAWICVAALCALLSTTACGGGSDDEADAATQPDSGPSPDGSPQVDAGPDAMPPLTGIDALCAPNGGVVVDMLLRNFDCIPWFSEAQFFVIFFGGVLTPERLSDLCYDQFQDYFTDGTLQIDESALGACRSWLVNAECYEFDLTELLGGVEPNNQCTDVLDGQVPTDGECEESYQCAGDAYCDKSEPDQNSCGVCADRLANSSPCSSNTMCSSNYCEPGDPATCADPSDIGDPCINDSDCIGQLYCDPEPDVPVCADIPPMPQVGDDCSQNAGACGFGGVTDLYCNTDLGECEQMPDVGDDCLDQGDIQVRCNVYHHEWCNIISGKCEGPETAAEGDSCALIANYQEIPIVPPHKCGPDLVCLDDGGEIDIVGTCVKVGGVGDSCTGDGDPPCHFMLTCDGDTGKCSGTDYTGLCPAP